MSAASRLVLLEQLHTIESGTKVRFLACVHAYNVQGTTVTLRDQYPATTADVPTAVVNVENILENVDHELLAVGAWVNVMGVVREISGVDASLEVPFKKGGGKWEVPSKATLVEASMMWSAGAIRLQQYKSAVQQYQEPLTAD